MRGSERAGPKQIEITIGPEGVGEVKAHSEVKSNFWFLGKPKMSCSLGGLYLCTQMEDLAVAKYIGPFIFASSVVML